MSAEDIQERDDELKKLIDQVGKGDFGLARTYWLFAVLGGLIILFFVNFLIIPLTYVLNTTIPLVFTFPVVIVYQITAILGVWRAADRYDGPHVWKLLARASVFLGWFGVGVSVIFFFSYIISFYLSGVF